MKFSYTNIKTGEEEDVTIYSMSIGKIIKLDEEKTLETSFDINSKLSDILKAKTKIISCCCDENEKDIQDSFDIKELDKCYKECLKISGFEIKEEKKTVAK